MLRLFFPLVDSDLYLCSHVAAFVISENYEMVDNVDLSYIPPPKNLSQQAFSKRTIRVKDDVLILHALNYNLKFFEVLEKCTMDFFS